MLVYLDNCCFNRPYDSQLSEHVKFEAEASLLIQQMIFARKIQLAWSFILDFENNANPYLDRKEAIVAWKNLATVYIPALETVKIRANQLINMGIQSKDALHVACGIEAKCDYFITTDKRLLKKIQALTIIHAINPINLVDALEEIQ